MQEYSENSGENTCFIQGVSCKLKFVFLPELSSVCAVPSRVCCVCLSEVELNLRRVAVAVGSRFVWVHAYLKLRQTHQPTKLCCFFLFYLASLVVVFLRFFSFLFIFWLHFAHKNTNMATERRLHLFLSMCCCCFWLFCYFLFSCGTKEFIFRVLKLAQNNVFCIFFSTLKLTVCRI